MVTTRHQCAVCLIEHSEEDFASTFSEKCEHEHRDVCNSCTYFSVKFTLESNIHNEISCPVPNCEAKYNSEEIRQILFLNNDHLLLEKYDDHLIRDLSSDNDRFLWCPYGCDCGQYIDKNSIPNLKITCRQCHKTICAFHRMKWHEGLECDQYDLLRSSTDESSLQWIIENTKRCPGCRSAIEKNGGCDHMTCAKCGQEFYWIPARRNTPLMNNRLVYRRSPLRRPFEKIASLARRLKF